MHCTGVVSAPCFGFYLYAEHQSLVRRATREVLAEQEAMGIDVVTDGEMATENYIYHLLYASSLPHQLCPQRKNTAHVEMHVSRGTSECSYLTLLCFLHFPFSSRRHIDGYDFENTALLQNNGYSCQVPVVRAPVRTRRYDLLFLVPSIRW